MVDRRTFIGTTLFGAFGAALAPGCGGAQHRLGASEIRELMARLDRGTRFLEETPTGTMAAELRGHARPDLSEQVVRLTIESLLVADIARSVPDPAAMPDELAARLAVHAPRVDRCTHTNRAYLARMPAAKQRALDGRVRREPERTMRGAEWLDGYASRLGIPADNRARLRAAAHGAGTRMRRQSAGAVVGQTVDHLDRGLAIDGSTLTPELERTTHAIVDAMWQDPVDIPAPPPAYGGPASPPAPSVAWRVTPHVAPSGPPLLAVPDRFASPGEMASPTEPVQWSDHWAQPGDEERSIGRGIMLGICPLLVIAGLIVFLVGEDQNAHWDGSTHEE